jgi:hypothetical protein
MKSDLMVKAIARLGQVRVREEWVEPGKHESEVYGCWQDGDPPVITINPAPHVVRTLLHEALHELYPTWKESAVRSMTGKLMKGMSSKQIWTLYEEYRRRVGRPEVV